MPSYQVFDYKTISPITQPIIPIRQGVKRHWGSHPYFTRRAWNVVQEYIRTFSQPGDTVLDPFGGSGVTAIESLVLKRKAIHCDINPLANFICEQIAVNPISIDAFTKAFDAIADDCKAPINQAYLMSDSEVEKLKLEYWYPQGIQLPRNADVKLIEDLFTKRQLFSLSLLHHHIQQIPDSKIRDLMRFVFSATLNKTNLTFSSTEGRAASRGNSGIMHRYRYWVPSSTLDLNVWEQFEQKFKNTVKFKLETNLEIGEFYSGNLSVRNCSATSLSGSVVKESVDYIYTDPPYGKHIAYLDLSTMWNAWLGFGVAQETRQLEVIEGGDLEKTKQNYIDLLETSIQEMFEVLKFDRWMSIVFAHKDPAYWDAIVKSAQNAGFEYVNTSVQPATFQSLHKKKNPLTVLSGELVLNFRKTRTPQTVAISKIGTDVVKIIKEIAELTIVKKSGASTEDIYNAIIPKLLENGLLSQVKNELNDVTPLLKEVFDYSTIEQSWNIRPNTKIGCFIPLEDRIRFYLVDYLNLVERKGEKATFEKIIHNVMPNLINGQTPKKQTILSVLKEIASPDGRHWKLGKDDEQKELDLGLLTTSNLLPTIGFPKDPNNFQHDLVIYILCKIAIAVGLKNHVGKKERAVGHCNGELLKDLSLSNLPNSWVLDTWQKKKIEQIDLIWIDAQNEPLFAFEIEKSTSITTGIDRFLELLKLFPDTASRIAIVIPPKRQSKLNEILRNSHYIGHPLYIEKKIVYSLVNYISDAYINLAAQTTLSLDTVVQTIKKTLIKPEI